jgi:hypothetical protein
LSFIWLVFWMPMKPTTALMPATIMKPAISRTPILKLLNMISPV